MHSRACPSFRRQGGGAKATCGTIRLELLKIGALVCTRTSVRRITFAMASGYPYQRDFALAHAPIGPVEADGGVTAGGPGLMTGPAERGGEAAADLTGAAEDQEVRHEHGL